MNRFLNSIYFKVLLLLILLLLLYSQSFLNLNKDFTVFIEASRLVHAGQNCYDVWIKVGTSGLKYFYSPLLAVLFFPLIHLPQGAANFVWLSLNLLLAYRILRLLTHYLELDTFSESKKSLFYFLLILCTGRFFFDCFSLGQMTIVLVWGSLESLRLIKAGNFLTGSALLALIINIKLIPLAVLAYLFYSGYFKAVTAVVVFSFIYLLLPAAFIGPQFNQQLLHNWYVSLVDTGGNSVIDDYGRQSLSSFVPAFLMDTPSQFGLKRNLLSLDVSTVNTILNSLRLILLLLLIWLFGKPLNRGAQNKKLFFDLALVCLATPLFFPHQGKYSFFYVLPAYAYLLFELMSAKILRQRPLPKITLIFTIISFVLLTLTTDGLIGRRLSDLCEYFQMISFGAMSLLAAMVTLKSGQTAGPGSE